jgi:parallel beta-helix repeat protein
VNKENTIIDGLESNNVILVSSNGVHVSNFTIQKSGTDVTDSGIEIYSDYNIVKENDIKSNNYGLRIRGSSDNNLIYHNNFINNNYNAYDSGYLNKWDNNYPSGGNYWDDYSGTDSNGDGIGDTAYDIPGGSSKDRYPFIKPIGWVNSPPNIPMISGPPSGTVGVEYEYTFITTDPDEDNVWYYVDWGDTSNRKWDGPYPSGEPLTRTYQWFKQDNYTIRCKAKDMFEAESDWGTLEITMPRSRAMNSWFLQMLERILYAFPILLNIFR